MKYKYLEAHMTNNCGPASPSKPSAPPTSKSKSQKNAWSDIMAPKSKGKDKDKSVLFVCILLATSNLTCPHSPCRDTSDADHIPKVSYDTLKDRQLKDKLAEQGLPTGGDRAAWIARHQRYASSPFFHPSFVLPSLRAVSVAASVLSFAIAICTR
jgi:E3 ubiquitin-protein ligase RAD18